VNGISSNPHTLTHSHIIIITSGEKKEDFLHVTCMSLFLSYTKDPGETLWLSHCSGEREERIITRKNVWVKLVVVCTLLCFVSDSFFGLNAHSKVFNVLCVYVWDTQRINNGESESTNNESQWGYGCNFSCSLYMETIGQKDSLILWLCNSLDL